MVAIRRICQFVFVGLLVLAGVRAAEAQTYVDKTLSRGSSTQDVIITVTPGHEADVLNTLQKHGDAVRSQHPSINGVAASIRGTDISDLAANGAVSIVPDAVVHGWGKKAGRAGDVRNTIDNVAAYGPAVSTLRSSLGLTVGAASNLDSGVNGSGIGIAIIDSGIAPSGDFDGRIVAFKDYVKHKTKPYDDFGHGTHVAGLIASDGSLSGYMFQGVAPRANLIVLKVLDKNGAGSTSNVIAALDYVIAHRNDLGIQIVNLSLGHPITAPARFDPLVQAVEKASQAGLIVVVAAGNDGPGYASINSPGNAPSAITVGAADGKTTVTRDDDYVPYFSSRGPTWYDGFAKPDVVAPGVNLYSDAAAGSTLVTSGVYPTQTLGTTLLDLSGTSMATAVATGVVALELDANAHQNKVPLTPNAAKAILEYTAISVSNAQSAAPATADDPGAPVAANALMQGAGQVNGAGAIALSGAINTTAQLNTGWLTTALTPSTTIVGEPYTWAQNIIWGTNVLSGNFMYYRGLMWDDNIIWGTGTIKGTTLVGSRSRRVRAKDSDNIIWGTDIWSSDNIVWGTDGDNIIWGTNLAPFRIVGERVGSTIRWFRSVDNIIWGTLAPDNIIWGTDDGDNIIWGTNDGDNIIWGTTADDNIIWGTDGDNIIWGTSNADDNIIWGTSAGKSILKTSAKDGDNIIWGTANGKLVVMAKDDGDNIIWGTADGDNIIWGTDGDNIIWGTDDGDNIIWGTDGGDNIIWGTSKRAK